MIQKSVLALVGQPPNLSLPASLGLFKLSCFGVGYRLTPIRPAINAHFARQLVEAADAEEHKEPDVPPGPGDYRPIQEFVEVCEQAALERHNALFNELSPLQTRGTTYVDEISSHPVRYGLTFLASFLGTTLALYMQSRRQ